MTNDTAPPAPVSSGADLAVLAAPAPGTDPPRIRRIEAAGRFYWVKTEERLTLRLRLQKGDPHRAFLAEREALKALSQAGLPVPPVVAESDSFFVTPDCGPSLRDVLRRGLLSTPERLAAFRAAAEGLAAFHARGLSHGRPSLKDICWDGRMARFLDLERYAARRNRLSGHAQDLVMLMLTAFAETGRPTAETRMLAETYRAHDPCGVWDAAARLTRRLRWLDPLTRPIQRRGAPEFRAIPLTLEAFST